MINTIKLPKIGSNITFDDKCSCGFDFSTSATKVINIINKAVYVKHYCSALCTNNEYWFMADAIKYIILKVIPSQKEIEEVINRTEFWQKEIYHAKVPKTV